MGKLLRFVSLAALLSVLLVGCGTEAEEKQAVAEPDGNVVLENESPAVHSKIDETGSSDEQADELQDKTQQEDADADVPGTIPAHVVRVVDGDTFEAIIDGREETVRLILVDTPETVHPSKPVEPFGPEASQYAKETLEGKDVRLELDVSERDQYGRVLAYVWIGDRMFNEMLLEKGLARVAVFPPDVKYVDRFREIEKEAKRKGIGIWSVENYAVEEEKSRSEEVAASPGRCADPKIKGNINSKGEKIYHVPGGQFYDVTIAEEMFCTEEEAQAAGYRKSKR